VLRAAARRLATGLTTLILVTWIVFALVHAAPGGFRPGEDGADEPLRALSAERAAQLRAIYHLDEPLHVQYARWLSDVLRGDLGRSFYDDRPVARRIAERIGTTLVLNLLSLAAMIALALPIGCAAASRPGSGWDRLAGIATYALYAVPAFWAALLLQIVFAVRLDWLPLYGLASDGASTMGPLARLADRAEHLVLPVTCLTYGGLAYLSRFVRANLLENAFGEAARAARARGVPAMRLLVAHGFRQAAVPMLTLAGFLLPALVAGSVIVESVFGIPGLGLLFIDAVGQRDVPMVMGLSLVSGSATLLGILAADLVYAAVDPRMGGADRG